jgi:hypothetical protein
MPSNTQPASSWLDIVEEFLQLFERNGYKRALGASEDSLTALRRGAVAQGLYVDDQWIELLRYVDGVSYDGLSFPGTRIDPNDPAGRSAFLFSNDPTFDFTDRDATVYGTSDLDMYRYSKKSKKFEVFGDTEIWESFDTFAELVEYAFGKVVEHLKSVSTT